ncbi:MAG: ComF family protein [Leptospiraceae bacterium]|nr:ComF family protein [Leptospiraceae bacterium]
MIYSILHFFFPLECIFCNKKDSLSKFCSVCKTCARKKLTFHEKLCESCSSIMETEECTYCNSRNIFFERIYFLRGRTEMEKEIIQKLKFVPRRDLGNFFRLGLKQITRKLFQDNQIDYMSFVPSNKKSYRERPFSSFEKVLHWIQKKYSIKTLSVLKKRSKELQSGKSYFDRFVHARFALEIQKEFQNKLSGNFLLIDDVFTTGATINEAARILLENGAMKVFVIVLTKSFPEKNSN